ERLHVRETVVRDEDEDVRDGIRVRRDRLRVAGRARTRARAHHRAGDRRLHLTDAIARLDVVAELPRIAGRRRRRATTTTDTPRSATTADRRRRTVRSIADTAVGEDAATTVSLRTARIRGVVRAGLRNADVVAATRARRAATTAGLRRIAGA